MVTYSAIMLFLLIAMMLIHIFLLLSSTITFYSLFKKQTLSVEGFAIWAGYGP